MQLNLGEITLLRKTAKLQQVHCLGEQKHNMVENKEKKLERRQQSPIALRNTQQSVFFFLFNKHGLKLYRTFKKYFNFFLTFIRRFKHFSLISPYQESHQQFHKNKKQNVIKCWSDNIHFKTNAYLQVCIYLFIHIK